MPANVEECTNKCKTELGIQSRRARGKNKTRPYPFMTEYSRTNGILKKRDSKLEQSRDPDRAIGISVCSHIINRADGYKFTSNTMAIRHRDIIKVMPIAPGHSQPKTSQLTAQHDPKATLTKPANNRNQTVPILVYSTGIPFKFGDRTSYN